MKICWWNAKDAFTKVSDVDSKLGHAQEMGIHPHALYCIELYWKKILY